MERELRLGNTKGNSEEIALQHKHKSQLTMLRLMVEEVVSDECTTSNQN